MRNTRLKKSIIEYWFIIDTNVLVIPYYISPWFLCRKLVSKFRGIWLVDHRQGQALARKPSVGNNALT